MARHCGYRGREIVCVTEVMPDDFLIPFIEVPATIEIPTETLMATYEVVNGVLRPKGEAVKKPRIAFVGVYKIACGISTYAESLWPAITSQTSETRIFCEEGVEASDSVVPCWKRGQSFGALIDAIDAFKPDVVHIQHEYGIFPDARHWLTLMSQLSARYKVYVTLHSVFRNHPDKVICEAAIPNIVVHTREAEDCLRLRGFANVTTIPHGTTRCTDDRRYWNRYFSPHTLVQFGFGFRYKGWETGIQAVAALKERYPDVFFTGVFSESPFSKEFHSKYYVELLELVDKLGVRDHVGLVRGFQTDEVLESFLRTSAVGIFPYIDNGAHTVLGCSGAARYAMRCAIPLIVGRVPLFSDLEGVCPRVATVEELVLEISSLFDSKSRIAAQVKKQNQFLEENRWETVASAHMRLYENSTALP